VTHESLLDGLSKGLNDVFESAQYVGQLYDFLGDRWWGSGCEAILWGITGGNSFDPAQTLAATNQHCGNVLMRSPELEPVLCVDENFEIGVDVCEIAKAVRVQPDDWPPYAEQAWVPLETARENARLRACVIAMDRELVSDEGQTGGEVE